jgi:hypothetical protein
MTLDYLHVVHMQYGIVLEADLHPALLPFHRLAGRPTEGARDLLAAKILSRFLDRYALSVRARQLVDIAIYKLVLAQRAPSP